MIPLDLPGRLPVPDSSGKAEVASGSPSERDQSDFSRWLAADSHHAAAAMPGEVMATELPVVVTHMAASSDTTDFAVAAGVLYSWQLHSQPFLSQIGSTSAMAEVGSAGVAGMGQGPEQALLDAVVEGRGQGAVLAPVEPSGSGNQSSTSTTAMWSMKSASASSAHEAVAGALAAASWMERMVRSVESPDRSITLWLRDYRLGQSEVSAAVEELLKAHPDSERIVRVVVNGREAWRNQPLESRSE